MTDPLEMPLGSPEFRHLVLQSWAEYLEENGNPENIDSFWEWLTSYELEVYLRMTGL